VRIADEEELHLMACGAEGSRQLRHPRAEPADRRRSGRAFERQQCDVTRNHQGLLPSLWRAFLLEGRPAADPNRGAVRDPLTVLAAAAALAATMIGLPRSVSGVRRTRSRASYLPRPVRRATCA